MYSNTYNSIIIPIFVLIQFCNMINSKKPNVLQKIKKLYNSILQYDFIDDDDEWNIFSKDSDTGEIIGFRNI